MSFDSILVEVINLEVRKVIHESVVQLFVSDGHITLS